MDTVTIPVATLDYLAKYYREKEAEYRAIDWATLAEWAQGKASVYEDLLATYATVSA